MPVLGTRQSQDQAKEDLPTLAVLDDPLPHFMPGDLSPLWWLLITISLTESRNIWEGSLSKGLGCLWVGMPLRDFLG